MPVVIYDFVIFRKSEIKPIDNGYGNYRNIRTQDALLSWLNNAGYRLYAVRDDRVSNYNFVRCHAVSRFADQCMDL